jgi:hypothetical protein
MPVQVTAAGVDEATDGRRLIVVRFVRHTDDAAEPPLVAVYHLKHPEGFTSQRGVAFLTPLSYTREDTHEAVFLTSEEIELVEEAVRDTAAADDPTW